MHVQLGDLPGRMVLDAAGVVLGRIKVPLVDMETWLVDALRVSSQDQVITVIPRASQLLLEAR